MYTRKRQFLLALFLCLYFTSLQALCVAKGELYQATVKSVTDGDTLILHNDSFKEDRKVRLVGLNTPELDYKNGEHDAFAMEAFQLLLTYQGQTIFYQTGPDKRDRYGRYLYYLFDNNRISIGSRLLSEGLGYRVAIPPNLAYQPCLMQVESKAKASRIGVWQTVQHWQPKAGFAVADIIVKSVTQNRGGWWLETNLNLAINLPKRNQDQWTAQEVYSLEGHRLTARGWQFYRKSKKNKQQEWVMLVKHPNDLVFE